MLHACQWLERRASSGFFVRSIWPSSSPSLGLGITIQQTHAGPFHPTGSPDPAAPTAAQWKPQHKPRYTQGKELQLSHVPVREMFVGLHSVALIKNTLVSQYIGNPNPSSPFWAFLSIQNRQLHPLVAFVRHAPVVQFNSNMIWVLCCSVRGVQILLSHSLTVYFVFFHLLTSWLTPSPAQSSSSLEAPSPAPLTSFPGAAAVQAFTGRATGGRHPLRTCLAWRGYWKLGPSVSFPKASPPAVDLKDHLTPMSPCCPSWCGPAWVCGGSVTSVGRSTHRYAESLDVSENVFLSRSCESFSFFLYISPDLYKHFNTEESWIGPFKAGVDNSGPRGPQLIADYLHQVCSTFGDAGNQQWTAANPAGLRPPRTRIAHPCTKAMWWGTSSRYCFVRRGHHGRNYCITSYMVLSSFSSK